MGQCVDDHLPSAYIVGISITGELSYPESVIVIYYACLGPRSTQRATWGNEHSNPVLTLSPPILSSFKSTRSLFKLTHAGHGWGGLLHMVIKELSLFLDFETQSPYPVDVVDTDEVVRVK
ncbi:putative uncharacterized protein [Pseudomonas sp. St290]|nr:putative uncharacterized protein [Pseudomonas sp. St290]